VNDQYPTVNAGPDIVSCPGGHLNIPIEVTGGTGTYSTYQWLPAEGMFVNGNTAYQMDAPMQEGSYTVRVTDANGCTGMDFIKVFINWDLSPTVDAGEDVNTCFMGAVELEAVATGGSGEYVYTWTSAGVETVANPVTVNAPISPLFATQHENHTVRVRDMVTGCISANDQVQVIGHQSMGPTVSVSEEEITVCFGATGEISATATGGTPPYSYSWSLNGEEISSQAQLEVPHSGNQSGSEGNGYWVMVTDADGCGTMNGVVVNYNSAMTVYASPGIPRHCQGEAVTLGTNVIHGGGTPPYSYLWSHPTVQIENPHELNAIVYLQHKSNFALRVTDSKGCEASHGNVCVVRIFELGPYQGFRSDAGKYCVDQPICIKEKSLGYELTWDIGHCPYDNELSSLPHSDYPNVWNICPTPNGYQAARYFSEASSEIEFDVSTNFTIDETDSKCIIISEPGQHTISVTYRPASEWWSTSPNCIGSFTETITVEPSVPEPEDELIFACADISGTSPNNDIWAMDIIVAGGCGPVLAQSGSDADYVAGNKVSMKPGFRAAYGSRFRAALNPCFGEEPGGMMVEQPDTATVAGGLREQEELPTDSVPPTVEADGDTLTGTMSGVVRHDPVAPKVEGVFRAYPNPTNGMLRLEHTAHAITSVEVLDAVGRLLFALSPNTLSVDADLSGFAQGTYLVRVQLANGGWELHRAVLMR